MDMHANEKIAVAGGTGRVGRHVVDVLETRGYDVVAMSRSTGVDVITREGLSDALDGVTAIVDAATQPSSEREAATAFFTTAARNLQDAGRDAGVQRLVVVSIIGADRFPGGYGAATLAHERASLAGPIPARILRAAQFHEFVGVLMDWGRQGDVVYVPDFPTQVVAARTVAEALADLAAGEPGPAEIAGPREERLIDLARLYAARTGDSARIEEANPSTDPDSVFLANGGALPGPGVTLAGPTFEEWLDALSPAARTRTPAR
jgi:uncharacterized protein YbjT (DUF2867 family)